MCVYIYMHYKYRSSPCGQNQRALGNITSQLMKNGQNLILQIGSGTRCSG